MITPISGVELTRAAQSLPDLGTVTSGTGKPADSFAAVLGQKINEANATQLNADASVQQLLAGEGGDIHQVMLAMEQARMSLMLVSSVRDKVLEAYQEVSRMAL
ncbi:MAG: flagellar hook-basal body complex protein FliE [Planctomycetota bacterium]